MLYYLGMVISKEQILKQWIDYANADLDAAQRLLKSARPSRWTYLLTLWHCQQTIEKGLKMIIIKKNKELLKIHDLQRLAEITAIELCEDDIKLIKRLNKYYLRSRYPDLIYEPLPNPDEKFTKDLFNKTERLFLWLLKQ